MNIPQPVMEGVTRALAQEEGSQGGDIVRSTPVGGGCINPSARVETEQGESYFLKWNASSPVEMFVAEADGLEALRRGTKATPLKVPGVVGRGGSGTPADPGWLLLEFVPRGAAPADYGEVLGRGLAGLHGGGDGEKVGGGPDEDSFGWHRDNYIGSLPQTNTEEEDWASFWRDHRLAPQVAVARHEGYFRGKEGAILDELLDRMPEILSGIPSPPALLHGDLWSGNYYPGPRGEPVLIDPAVYRGAGEVDLAMMELFGSLPQGFREAYGEARGLGPEYDAFLRDLYQLYYLLVHVNLFGGGYAGGSLRAARSVLHAV